LQSSHLTFHKGFIFDYNNKEKKTLLKSILSRTY